LLFGSAAQGQFPTVAEDAFRSIHDQHHDTDTDQTDRRRPDVLRTTHELRQDPDPVGFAQERRQPLEQEPEDRGPDHGAPGCGGTADDEDGVGEERLPREERRVRDRGRLQGQHDAAQPADHTTQDE
jgi:hypothetical protein